MTSDAVPVGGDPRRLLADVHNLTRQVRIAQRVTWLPLLILGLVTFGAIPVYLLSHPILSDCRAIPNGEVCRAFYIAPSIYWWTALTVAYIVIAAGFLRVARRRGLGPRVRPYVFAGLALVALSAAITAVFVVANPLPYPGTPSRSAELLLRTLDPTGIIGLALLVLAWLERRVTLLLFATIYLVVVLVPVNFGWGAGWHGDTQFVPQLVINGTVLLLGSAGFAYAHRRGLSR
ncbi:hypothetical protein Dvina_25440 [Dactylosporangium vinaceum]|uniref:DUF998 domain-containing protein n=1 Tax=Dactylosporangium vinaceum TaxID=53362 RepID=A0ABV5MDP5_9ACTN|nr:hypothetical protein [Dactylosporangium vinaceum]UAC01102.1 hypothetical protein Dvina_25440 [Dactylosporangium vinaceum]